MRAESTTLPSALGWMGETPFYQAGLQGYSDAAMRLVARRRGCPYCVTEAIVDDVLLSGGKAEASARLDDEDHPIAGQLMGSDPGSMARAAQVLVRLEYDVVDINLACPVKRMGRRRRGGLLLARPEQAIDVLRAVADAVAGVVPLTVKLRRGFDDSAESAAALRQILDASAKLGFASATVHARTVTQKYSGSAVWPFLTTLIADYPHLPICGSGDVTDAAAILAMRQETGVRAVAVARGAIAHPWVFQQARALLAGETPRAPTRAELRAALEEQWQLMLRVANEKQTCRQMRKIAIKFAETWEPHPDAHREFTEVRTPADWQAAVKRYY